MVGFISEPSIEEESNQVSKPESFKKPVDFSDPKTNDLSFPDSFLDLDSIRDSFLDLDSVRDWFEDNSSLDRIGSEDGEFGRIEKYMEVVKEDNFEETPVSDPSVVGFEPNTGGIKPNVSVSVLVGGELGCTVKPEEEESKAVGKISSSIEKVMEKFNLIGDRSSGSEESDSESSSSSSSSSSSDEEEEEDKVKAKVEREVDGAGELEEGELDGGGTDSLDDDDKEQEDKEEILGGFGYEFDEVDDEDDDLGGMKGPIKSINELEVLTPVPAVDVKLQPHHSMLPVGVVSSIIGTVVIVEGREQHNPLNEGSILWITINRTPLGFVDEIFGPVKNPYYKVRYNSESEIPSGIDEGTSISFVPEFADHVLNDKTLYQKGYDASGENDEELLDEAEFSDDEKEAEYKRMQKITKRGMNDHRVGKRKNNKKKVQTRDDAWKNSGNSTQQTSTTMGQLPLNQNHHSVPSEQSLVGGSGVVPPFYAMAQSSDFIPPSNGVRTDWMLNQHPQDAMFSNMFPAQRMPLLSQNYQQQPFPLPTMMPYQQQLGTSLSIPPNAVLPGSQPNLFAGTAFAPWLGIANQNQTTFGMAMQGQQLLNAVQSILASGQAVDGNYNVQPLTGNFETPQNFNMGASSSRGRNQYHRGRGRGRFTGRRGNKH